MERKRISPRYVRLLRAGSSLLLVLALSACSETLYSSRILRPTEGEVGWTDLHALDLTEVSSGLASDGCGSDAQPATFEDFKLVSDSGKAVLVASLCELSNGNATARPYGRLYHAESVERTGEDGAILENGWALAGADFQALSGTSLGDIRDVTAAISPEGDVKAVFWDFANAPNPASGEASWSTSGGWASEKTGTLTDGATTVDGLDLDEGSGTLEAFDNGGSALEQSLDSSVLDLWNGVTKDLIWDASGQARLAVLNGGVPEVRAASPASNTWSVEASGFTPAATPKATQVRLIDDGFRTVLMWVAQDPLEDRVSPGVTSKLYAINSDETADIWQASTTTQVGDDDNDLHALNPTSNSMTRAFSAATDQQGTIVSVFLSRHSDELSISCSSQALNCDFRMYASVQSPDGLWTGPTPVDESFALTKSTTTYAQKAEDFFNGSTPVLQYSAKEPGLQFATPQVAYLGDGRFLVVGVISDYTDTDAPVTRIFSRAYTVGSGWDPESDILQVGDDFAHVADADTEIFNTYRPVNELKLAANGAGHAVLLTQITDPDDTEVQGDGETRTWVHAAYSYSPTDGWGDQELFGDEIPCPALANQDPASDSDVYITGCGYGRMEAAVLEGGESVVVFPAPASTVGNPLHLGLFGSEKIEAFRAEASSP